MDEIVKAAMAKWPNVPHCYGWLALDPRGQWRMRDERCQKLNLPGDIIRHPTLIDFINRNYQCDGRGCWYFQNGPQRVYVDLAATPYIVHTTTNGLQLHTNQAMPKVTAVYFDASGNMMLAGEKVLALVDDRDLPTMLNHLNINGRQATDEELLVWLEMSDHRPALELNFKQTPDDQIIVQKHSLAELMTAYGYSAKPLP